MPELPLWFASPRYCAVTVSVPPLRLDVVQVAVPEPSELVVTVDALQPVFVLQLTVPVIASGPAFLPRRLLPFAIAPFWPSIVAVNVIGCPYVDGFALDATETLVVASLIVKLLLCPLFDPV